MIQPTKYTHQMIQSTVLCPEKCHGNCQVVPCRTIHGESQAAKGHDVQTTDLRTAVPATAGTFDEARSHDHRNIGTCVPADPSERAMRA